ncbi:hypothetical protein F5Y10DRAFT_266376 [Nemania abortiva]|nr:hypothetical protein F5Y10DRAFT_266376 [Nemania abortiva]
MSLEALEAVGFAFTVGRCMGRRLIVWRSISRTLANSTSDEEGSRLRDGTLSERSLRPFKPTMIQKIRIFLRKIWKASVDDDDIKLSDMPPILQATLTPIVDPKEAEIDIVAVHGLNRIDAEGHASDTWRSGDKLWLRDFLPAKAPRMRVLLFGYNSNAAFSSAGAGVEEVVQDLLNLIMNSREDPDRPLIFVCHSLGGLIVKRAIVRIHDDDAYKKIRVSTSGLAFFGTPHRGSNNAGWGDVVAGVARSVLGSTGNTLIEGLKKDSLFTRVALNTFRLLEPCYKIISFYETRTLGSLGLVVEKESATLGLALAVDADHSHICRFESAEDPNYKQVETNLLRMMQDAVDCGSRETMNRALRSMNMASVHSGLTNQDGHQNRSHVEGDLNETRQLGGRNWSSVVGTGNRVYQDSGFDILYLLEVLYDYVLSWVRMVPSFAYPPSAPPPPAPNDHSPPSHPQ